MPHFNDIAELAVKPITFYFVIMFCVIMDDGHWLLIKCDQLIMNFNIKFRHIYKIILKLKNYQNLCFS